VDLNGLNEEMIEKALTMQANTLWFPACFTYNHTAKVDVPSMQRSYDLFDNISCYTRTGSL